MFNQALTWAGLIPAMVPNATATATATSAPAPTPTDLTSLLTFMFSLSGIPDWAKLLIIGTVLETVRRFASSIWTYMIDSMFIVAHFEGGDDAYQWMLLWLSRQPAWQKAREVQISTRQWGPNMHEPVFAKHSDDDDTKTLVESRKLSYLPSWDVTHTMMFNRHIMRVTRSRQVIDNEYHSVQESLLVSILAPGGNHGVLNSLLLEAKKMYEAEEQNRVNIYVAGAYNDWRRTGSRPKRPLESIVLDPAIKQLLLDDAREFLVSEPWYGERGIPYRRGYLLYGSPGSGKTSLIQSIAGALDLDIYIVNLAKRGLDDSGLNELICDMPPRAIALIEEIDAAFHHGITREAPSSSGPPGPPGTDTPSQGVTLSGLLGAIDGIGAAEGRILFATTNKYLSLDPALTRPGRLDIHIKFELATKAQAEELFKCFYPATATEEEAVADTKEEDASSAGSPTALSTGSATPTLVNEKPSVAPLTTSSITTSGMKSVISVSSRMPKLTRSKVDALAAQFAAAIPEKEFSMAALQGLLMGFKVNPVMAVEEAPRWVEIEREKMKERERELEGKKAEAAAIATAATAATETAGNNVVEGTEKVEEKVVPLQGGNASAEVK